MPNLIECSTQFNHDLERQSDLWSRYCELLIRAQRSREHEDIAQARKAWYEFLPEYLPNADERSAVQIPSFLRKGGR